MAKTIKTKKISVTAFDKVMRDTRVAAQTVEWNGIEITIKHTLSLKDMLAFVDSVTKSCFLSENNAYIPEVKAFAIKCCVLELYANFVLPANVEHKYDLVYNTDAFDVVIQYVNMKQLNEIVDAISDKVDNLAQANIEAVQKQMYDMCSTLNDLQKQISSVFDGINSEDVSKFIGAVAEGGLDEEKLVQAYFKHEKEETGE